MRWMRPGREFQNYSGNQEKKCVGAAKGKGKKEKRHGGGMKKLRRQ